MKGLQARRRRASARKQTRLHQESLEKKLALAYGGFSSGPNVTLTVSGGDHIYLQQVAKESQSLYVSNDSSFPLTDRLEILNIDSFDTIRIVNGSVVENDRGVLQNAPVFNSQAGGFPVRFLLSNGYLGTFGQVFSSSVPLTGTFSCIQPDGTKTSWQFVSATNADGRFDYTDLRIQSGIGFSVPASVGYLVPQSIRLDQSSLRFFEDFYDDVVGRSSLEVQWSHEPAVSSSMMLDSCGYGAERFGQGPVQEVASISASAPQANASFQLPSMASRQYGGVVANALFGSITLPQFGVSLPFRTLDNTLVFDDNPGVARPNTIGLLSREQYAWLTVSGSVDRDSGVVRLTFTNYVSGLDLDQLAATSKSTPQTPGVVQLEATYGVHESLLAETTNSATVFAGHDIDARLDVDLSGLGSTINIDSPVKMNPTTAGEFVLRASAINLNSPVVATNRMVLGGASRNANSIDSLQGQAIAEIGRKDGKQAVIRVTPVAGFEGHGYDPANPPLVTIGLPETLRATAFVTQITGGLSAIDVQTNGVGYRVDTPPAVTVQAPAAGGVTATARAIVDDEGGITRIVIVTPGSGYTFNPTITVAAPPPPGPGALILPVQVTATARISGAITGVAVSQSGYGYDAKSPPVVTFLGGSVAARGTAVVDPVSRKVTAITLTAGGDGYPLGIATVEIAAPPANTAGRPAVAEAIVDAGGRIVAYTVKDGGDGYGAIPKVVVGSPIQLPNESTIKATVSPAGRVSSVMLPGSPVIRLTSGGSGYVNSSNVIVTISPPTDPVTMQVRSGGRAATARAILDRGAVSEIQIVDPGFGYLVNDAPPTVAITDLSASGQVGTGAITVAIIIAGAGYPIDRLTSENLITVGPPASFLGERAVIETELDYDKTTGIGSRGIKKITVLPKGNTGYSTNPLLAPKVSVNRPDGQANVQTVAESIRLNTLVEASNFEIFVADDPRTGNQDRGVLLITQAGSLSRLGGGIAADSVYIEAAQADVYLEGSVVATKQSYLTNSPDSGSLYGRAPYALTTTSPTTGAQVGVVRGSTVSVTLGNGGPVPDASQDWISAHSVDLQTDIDSLRIRAANGVGQSIASAYPYELRVVDQGDITFDAVAASSRRIDLSAKGNIKFSSSLSTAGDLSIDAGGDFDVTAPISSTVGQISLRASNVIVNSTISVSAAARDALRDDITITATQGDVLIQSAVKAVNNVTIQQINRRDPTAAEYSNRTPLPIADNQTVRQTVTILDDFSFTDLNVAVDATHSFVSDLSLTLIAPDGTRVRLFASNGGSGDNLTGTVFDSEAAASIYEGSAPFTGAFRPVDSLAPLYGRSVRGTWTLEVRDGSSGDQGSLTNFALRFANATPQEGRVAGNARIIADRLRLDVQGSVGNQSLPPTATAHYLRTKVNVVNADVGGNISISDTDRLQVESMRTSGAVAIRAQGVDDVVGQSSALSGSLYDLSRLDIEVPNGSVDLLLNTSKTIVLGNGSAIAAGQSVINSVAGSVRLKSASSGFIVLDAPVAGGSARTVRFSPQQDLPGTYAAGAVGIQASTLIGTGDLNGLVGVPADSPKLAIGDRILLQKQNQPRRNGVYTVTSLTSASW